MINQSNNKTRPFDSTTQAFLELFWPYYPLRSSARSFLRERGPIAGIAVPGQIVDQFPFDQPESESYYVPTGAEILVVKRHFPGSAEMIPPWHLIQAKLCRIRRIQENFGELTAPAVIALLGDESASRPQCSSERKNVNQKMFSMLEKDNMLYSLTCKQWAALLDCSPQAVGKTKTWKFIMSKRANNKKLLADQKAQM